MLHRTKPPSLSELRTLLHAFCQKHRIRRLDVFGSAAHGLETMASDVDMLVTTGESAPPSTAELLEMAGEAEELVSAPVDFVLLQSLEKSPNRYAREHILATAVCIYGSGPIGRLRDILNLVGESSLRRIPPVACRLFTSRRFSLPALIGSRLRLGLCLLETEF